MPKLTIDGMEVTVEPGTSILQAAEQGMIQYNLTKAMTVVDIWIG